MIDKRPNTKNYNDKAWDGSTGPLWVAFGFTIFVIVVAISNLL